MSAVRETVVLKIGGSVLVGEDGWKNAVRCVRREHESGARLLVVVSATNGTTEALLSQARARSESPAEPLLARLLRAGEESSAALMGMALEANGVPAEVRDAAWLDLAVMGPRLDAEPVGIDASKLEASLTGAGVLVVPGFVGRHVDGGPALLGRGGSDLTAVFLAGRLGARCRLIKDVDGLYRSDPRAAGPAPDRYVHATWQTVIERGAELVQAKAVRLAERLDVRLTIAGMGEVGTSVGSQPDLMESEVPGSVADPGRLRRLEAAS